MGYEDSEGIEKLKGGKPKSSTPKMTLQKAIELGEYDPAFLSTFPEWSNFSRHVQFQHIRTALDNRENQLRVQWAEVVNFLDFSKKPHLKDTLDNIQKQLKSLDSDREKLYLKYSG